MRSVLRWGVLGAQGEHRRAARHHTAQASSAQIQPQTGCSCGCHSWLQQWLLVKLAQGGSLCGVFPWAAAQADTLTSCRARPSASEQCVALQDGSYMQDRRMPPLADMAKPEAKLAEMVKEESKPAAEANGAMPHIKSESQQAAAQVLVRA